MITADLEGAEVLWPYGFGPARLSIQDGLISESAVGRPVDLSGFLVLPGIVDAHGDGFERHVAPRRGAMTDAAEGLVAAEAEMAAQGITTGTVAQFWSWEGGLRGPEFAETVFTALDQVRRELVTDLHGQLRFETHLLEDYAALPKKLDAWGVNYVVFNDHLPHDRLAEGRRPPRLTGQALKAGRNPDRHFELLTALHARGGEVSDALDVLCCDLLNSGIRLGSHDDRNAQDRDIWKRRGARIAEFPETREAAKAARQNGDYIILGAPNVVRGGSHKGNASAAELVAEGFCDALASDYHYPSPRRAVFALVDAGIASLDVAWGLVSSGPAKVLGLDDRGTLRAGMRADLVVIAPETRRVEATISGGRISYMVGNAAERFAAG